MLFERVVLSPTKVAAPLRQLHTNATSVFKDTYLVEFLDLPPGHSEAELQRGLVEQLTKFLIELGRDFCYVGSQYPIQVGGRDFALDLLFFNRALNCLVAFELKVVEFEPEHVGKLHGERETADVTVRVFPASSPRFPPSFPPLFRRVGRPEQDRMSAEPRLPVNQRRGTRVDLNLNERRNSMRKLASIQIVNAVEPIRNADAIEKIRVLGWWVVVMLLVIEKEGRTPQPDFGPETWRDLSLNFRPATEGLSSPRNRPADLKRISNNRLGLRAFSAQRGPLSLRCVSFLPRVFSAFLPHGS